MHPRLDEPAAVLRDAGDHHGAGRAGPAGEGKVQAAGEAVHAGGPNAWQAKRQTVIDRLGRGPCWYEHFLDLYRTRQAIHEQLKRLMELKHCRMVGWVSVAGEGRPRL